MKLLSFQQAHLERSLAPNHRVSAKYKATIQEVLSESPDSVGAEEYYDFLDRAYQAAAIKGKFKSLENSSTARKQDSRKQRNAKKKAAVAKSED